MSARVLCRRLQDCRTRPVFFRSPAVLGGCGVAVAVDVGPCSLIAALRALTVTITAGPPGLPFRLMSISADCRVQCQLARAVFFTMTTCMSGVVSALARARQIFAYSQF